MRAPWLMTLACFCGLRRQHSSAVAGVLLCCSAAVVSCGSEPAAKDGAVTSASTDSQTTATESGGDENPTWTPESGGHITPPPEETTASSNDSWDDGSDIRFDLGPPIDLPSGDHCDGVDKPTPDAWIEGVVLAPDGALPISDALVYVTDDEVAGIPNKVYCDTCVELDCDLHWVRTEPDGSFRLPTLSGTNYNLVVRKGQFMRITTVDVAEGTSQAPAEQTTLPRERDADKGWYIPNMAVILGGSDGIEDVLAKVGLGDTVGGEMLDIGSEPFDLFNSPSTNIPNTKGPALDMLRDRQAMDKYHVIFVPCGGGGSASVLFNDPMIVENVRDWVGAGGKLYATDYAQDTLEIGFPEYQTFYTQAGNSDLFVMYESNAEVLDEGLLAWLESVPPPFDDINAVNNGGTFPTLHDLPMVRLQENFVVIKDLLPVQQKGSDGELVDVSHHTWLRGDAPFVEADGIMDGDLHPMTITGTYGCGRIMYSTYHTAGLAHQSLSPQELTLMYIILELTVCENKDVLPPNRR